MQSFNKGMDSGAPFSAPPNSVPHPITPTEQVTHTSPTTPAAVVNPVVHAPVVDSPAPQVPHPEPAAAPIVTSPVAPNPGFAAPASSTPLPTYGADLRPPTTTTAPSLPSSSPVQAATPSSAPVHPSSGQAGTGQPAVVRQTPAPTKPPPPPATEAVAATATGAAAGAASADATARARLQRLVNSVARQQPRLAWAAGDRPDDTTLLTTDLASGWIPPGIELPAAVTLLPPARRRGNIEALLGEVTVAAGYTPIHHVSKPDEPIPTSPRPRQVPEIDELGWELGQATQWRDGLPRLAHTLAKAASAGTGVLDSEVDLLRQHLKDVSNKVLDSYPGNVDAHDIGNWQLLAAIDALVTADKAAANYHLAWFHACSR
ncbi:hypothetical protein A9W95_12310 [Mycobacterium sp. 1423905.2]|nr:hypothetical protein A9W95_12310 [Mycobacterium sp. 1423905.2]